ncbi:MAG: TatD family hydrolase [Myxococcota bacterium]|nr:TatD family hydrolase [Myxococcota bacterium]
MPGLLDSHCHLDFPAYDGQRDALLTRAREAGVQGVVVPATHPDTWARTCSMAALPGVRVALGLHPVFIPRGGLEPGDLAGALQSQLVESGAVAVGECGLHKGPIPFSLQEQLLRVQLQVARALDLPVILHCVGAHGRLLALLQDFGPLRGVLHSYSGSAEMVPAYAALGLHFSFGWPVTWEEARRVRSALSATPPGRLMVESDGPDLPHRRGHPSADPPQPADVAAIAAHMAALGHTPGWGPFTPWD